MHAERSVQPRAGAHAPFLALLAAASFIGSTSASSFGAPAPPSSPVAPTGRPGTPVDAGYLPSVANYVPDDPDDPAFAHDVAPDHGLRGEPIGPVRALAFENG